MIPYGKQSINEGDIDAVVDVLKSDFLTQGPVIAAFEKSLANKVKAEYAVACNSATSALHIACLALGVSKGDEVWTSPISFVASANCALYCGATVDFVDVELATGNMSAQALEQKLHHRIANKQPLPKVIIPVHLAGNSCDMKRIASLAREFNIKIIEDASHAIGASYLENPVGCCHYSDITVFSFHPVKIITTGEGGMALTNHPELYESMQKLKSHGVTKVSSEMESYEGDWYYEQQSLGYNYRMTDIQAALGLSQLERINAFISQRRELATNYSNSLKDLPIHIPMETEGAASSWHLYILRLNNAYDRRLAFDELRKKGIGVHVHYIPIYKQPYYQRMGFKPDYCENAELFYASILSIPLYHGMSPDDQSYVLSSIREVLQ